MTYKQKADFVVWGHIFYIFTIIISLPLLFLISWWYKVALVLTASTFLSWIILRGYCWITKLENKFRKKHNSSSAYTEGFIQHHLINTFRINLSPLIFIVILDFYIFILFFIALKQAYGYP